MFTLPRPTVQHVLDLAGQRLTKEMPFGDKLTDQAVDILVAAMFAERVRME